MGGPGRPRLSAASRLALGLLRARGPTAAPARHKPLPFDRGRAASQRGRRISVVRGLPAASFVSYVVLCFALGEVYPFSKYDMYAGAVSESAIILVRADDVPVELPEFAAFTGDLGPLAAPELREIAGYIKAYSESGDRSRSLTASQAFLDVETGLGRYRGVPEVLLLYARWSLFPPVLDSRTSTMKISRETVRFDRPTRTLERTSRPIWQGTARRIR